MENDGRFYELQDREQPRLFAPSLRQAVGEDREVLVLDEAVARLDFSGMETGYRRVGHPAYHPTVMLKVLLFGYAHGLRSSRELARACRKDDDYRFLAHGLAPDFRTICRFRREQAAHLKELFTQTVRLCQQAGLVSLGHVAIDGTKLRANRSFEAQGLLAKALEEAEIADADIVTEESRFMKTAAGVKPAYNGQLAVDASHQVIVAQEVVTAQTDVAQLQEMVEQVQENCAAAPAAVSADGGYYNQAAIAALQHSTQLHVPSPQTGAEALEWVESEQAYRCPMGHWLKPYRKRAGKQIYRTHHCTGCEHAKACKVTGRFKELHICTAARQALEDLKKRLQTATGRAIYAARKQLVELLFAHFKHNWGFRRLLLSGCRKAGAEWSLLCIAHNLRKWMKYGYNGSNTSAVARLISHQCSIILRMMYLHRYYRLRVIEELVFEP